MTDLAAAPEKAVLLVEKGAQRVSYDELESIETPPPTDSWHPVGHSRVLEMVTGSLENLGFRIEGMDLAVAYEGNQFFGTLDLRSEIADGVTLAVGVRNSIDKSLSAAMCAGDRCIVCSNLCFGSEISISRKHTTNVERDFLGRITSAVTSLRQFANHSGERITAMQKRILHSKNADSLMLRSYEKGIVGARLLPKLIQEWREPSYPEFEIRTAWSMYNAFTHVMKARQQSQPVKAAAETIKFGQLCV